MVGLALLGVALLLRLLTSSGLLGSLSTLRGGLSLCYLSTLLCLLALLLSFGFLLLCLSLSSVTLGLGCGTGRSLGSAASSSCALGCRSSLLAISRGLLLRVTSSLRLCLASAGSSLRVGLGLIGLALCLGTVSLGLGIGGLGLGLILFGFSLSLLAVGPLRSLCSTGLGSIDLGLCACGSLGLGGLGILLRTSCSLCSISLGSTSRSLCLGLRSLGSTLGVLGDLRCVGLSSLHSASSLVVRRFSRLLGSLSRTSRSLLSALDLGSASFLGCLHLSFQLLLLGLGGIHHALCGRGLLLLDLGGFVRSLLLNSCHLLLGICLLLLLLGGKLLLNGGALLQLGIPRLLLGQHGDEIAMFCAHGNKHGERG